MAEFLKDNLKGKVIHACDSQKGWTSLFEVDTFIRFRQALFLVNAMREMIETIIGPNFEQKYIRYYPKHETAATMIENNDIDEALVHTIRTRFPPVIFNPLMEAGIGIPLQTLPQIHPDKDEK